VQTIITHRSWHALWVPKGTPDDVIHRLNVTVVNALGDTVVRKKVIYETTVSAVC
jgi:tripartite-type tricarboxylate transporter receptor subunit TctC